MRFMPQDKEEESIRVEGDPDHPGEHVAEEGVRHDIILVEAFLSSGDDGVGYVWRCPVCHMTSGSKHVRHADAVDELREHKQEHLP